jgi:hypothetical protein
LIEWELAIKFRGEILEKFVNNIKSFRSKVAELTTSASAFC